MKLTPTQLNRVTEDMESVRNLPSPQKVTVPLFSRMGLNMLYVMVRNAFRIKTPDERLLKKMTREAQIKQKLNMYQ